MRPRLAVHAWGDEDAPRLVCLHGVTSHGRHFRPLAERLADRFHVRAPDLLGHGDSPWEPPWDVGTHVDALLEALGDRPATWLGHSFGARLAFELAAREARLVERLVLVDPAILLPAHVALFAAENARTDRSYVSFGEGIERRFEESRLGPGATRETLEHELSIHLVEDEDGRFRYRYCQAAVVTAYSEMSRQPPPFEAVDVPTLLVLGRDSYLPYDHLLDAHRAAAGDRLEVAIVNGGHTVLWDAFDDTADAVERFLAAPPQRAVLTRLPVPHRAESSLVQTFLADRFPEPWLTLGPEEHRDLVGELASLGLSGGATYDALVSATARAAGARLVT